MLSLVRSLIYQVVESLQVPNNEHSQFSIAQ